MTATLFLSSKVCEEKGTDKSLMIKEKRYKVKNF